MVYAVPILTVISQSFVRLMLFGAIPLVDLLILSDNA